MHRFLVCAFFLWIGSTFATRLHREKVRGRKARRLSDGGEEVVNRTTGSTLLTEANGSASEVRQCHNFCFICVKPEPLDNTSQKEPTIESDEIYSVVATHSAAMAKVKGSIAMLSEEKTKANALALIEAVEEELRLRELVETEKAKITVFQKIESDEIDLVVANHTAAMTKVKESMAVLSEEKTKANARVLIEAVEEELRLRELVETEKAKYTVDTSQTSEREQTTRSVGMVIRYVNQAFSSCFSDWHWMKPEFGEMLGFNAITVPDTKWEKLRDCYNTLWKWPVPNNAIIRESCQAVCQPGEELIVKGQFSKQSFLQCFPEANGYGIPADSPTPEDRLRMMSQQKEFL